MKRKNDPRHKARQKLIKEIFVLGFIKPHNLKQIRKKSKNGKTAKIIDNIDKINLSISKSAPAWPIEKIAKIDLAILRLAVYELLIEKIQPKKVIIDEAIELAKEYGGEKSPSFVNGVLSTLLKGKLKNKS